MEQRTVSSKRRGRRFALLAAVVVLAVVAPACGDDSGTGDSADPESQRPSDSTGADQCTQERIGGTLTMGMFSATRGLDPAVLAGSGVAGGIEAAAIFDRLMRYNPETARHEPWVAESLEPNADFTSWTLKLRDEVKFGNGDPLTADVVKASIERMRSEEINKTNSRAAALRTGEITVADPNTVVFALPKPDPGFPGILSDEVGMIVNTRIAASMPQEQFNANPVGAGVGPYEPARFAQNEDVVLRAKSDYWAGPVCIQELRFRTLQSGALTAEALRLGELDIAYIREPATIDALVREGDGGNFTGLTHMGQALLVNNGLRGTKPPTADPRIRKAISAAIDVELLNERVPGGTGIPTQAIVTEESPFFPEGLEGPRYDPDMARELVEQVKAEGAWDGGIELICDSAQRDLVVTLEAMLEQAGFDVRTDTNMTVAERVNRVRVDANFELACWGLTWSEADVALRMYQNFHSSQNIPHGYVSPEMDAAIEALQQATTNDAVKSALGDMQELWNRDMPSIPLASVPEAVVWGAHVHGIVPTSKTVVLFNQAFLDE
jgi:peptide/nickel transport system substrate-binding protein